MQQNLLIMLLLTGLHTALYAQIAKPVTISGQINTDKDSVQLVVWFAKDPTIGVGEENERIPVRVDRDGRFSFTTAPINQLARLSLHDATSRNQLFNHEQQIIAPGDRVQVFANIHDQGEPYYFKAVFFGKGAAKFECTQALKVIDISSIDRSKFMQQMLLVYDSLLQIKQKVVDNFRNRLSMEEYQLIQADITGELKSRALMKVCGYNFGSIHNPKPGEVELLEKMQQFDVLVQHIDSVIEIKNSIAQSITYRQYLYQKAKAQLFFENKGEAVQLKQLYQHLCNNYTGLLQEKLLVMLLLNSAENYYFFGGINAEEYATCLQDASTKIKSVELRARFKRTLDGLAKGAPAYNFTLPKDSSSTKTISLSDFKGKVVLLDLWSYNCTGCLRFTQTFHKKIYPFFKDNPAFAVASIMLGESSKDAYMRRLRSKEGVVYTYPEYINLFGGTGIASARAMEAWYNIDAFPTLLLVDKQGKIYSSTLPAIYGDPRNKELDKNAEKLIKLINDALAEPGIQK